MKNSKVFELKSNLILTINLFDKCLKHNLEPSEIIDAIEQTKKHVKSIYSNYQVFNYK